MDNTHQWQKNVGRIFTYKNFLLGRSNLRTVYWDIKLVNGSQPDQKALPLHFII